MNQIQEKIAQYKHELSRISSSDALVNAFGVTRENVQGELNLNFELALSPEWKKMLVSAKKLQEEADVNPLCLVSGLVKWKYEGKVVETPLLLTSVHWKIDKIKNSVLLNIQAEQTELNPFIHYVVKEKLGKEPEFPEVDFQRSEALVHYLSELGFTCEWIDFRFFANLHFHRFHLLRELEFLQEQERFSQPLQQLFGESTQQAEFQKLTHQLLTDADTDQEAVFEKIRQGNLVVQGPPGTGKSQVILNLLGKLVDAGKRTLVMSEKRVALEVIEKKLEQLDLGLLAITCHSQTTTRHFLEKLELSWRKLEESSGYTSEIAVFEDRLKQFQLFLDRLNQHELLGGVSLNTFRKLNSESPFEEAISRFEAPDLAVWLAFKPEFIQLEESLGDLKGLRGLRQAFFQHENMQRLLEKLQKNWIVLKQELTIETLEELNDWYAKLGRIQLVENVYFSFYQRVSAKKSDKKKFREAVEKYRDLLKQLELIELEMQVWKNIPTSIQIASWKIPANFWQKRKRKTEIENYLAVEISQLEKAISIWEKWRVLKQEINELDRLFLNWGLETGSAQVEAAYAVFNQFEKAGSLLQEISMLPSEKRQNVLRLGEQIQSFRRDFQLYFQVADNELISDFLNEKLQLISEIKREESMLKTVPNALLGLLNFASGWKSLQAIILKANWLRLTATFPELSKHNGSSFLRKIADLITCQEEEFVAFSNELRWKQERQFARYTELLRTPSAKLPAEEKALKQQLKRGKAILVKEFGKTRQHPSIRTLLTSEARIWIQTCFPIWLSTPNLVADLFPLEQDLFDQLIVDEASQMPLPNALGAIQRSNRVLIAGDEQQMSPSTFFGKAVSEHDLLHQASFYYPAESLKHHYRSKNSRLIDFSNQHFYQNQLLVYPGPEKYEAVVHHFVPNGIYENRVNLEEAKAVAKFIEQLGISKTLGLVAFSKEQLKCIWNQFSSEFQDKLLQEEENNRFFAKSLDEVQGDEAEVIVVSLGYGKNNEGDFQLRFGPINQANGYKRLNVLLTRAIESFHCFASVKSVDFPLSENENVNLLRQYIDFAEKTASIQELKFPFNIQPVSIQEDKLVLEELETTIPNAQELLTFVNVLQLRGWNLTLQ